MENSKSQYAYTSRNDGYEAQLHLLLSDLRRCPGVLIGDVSLQRMAPFLSGYEYAFLQLTGYRLHFDREFQESVLRSFQTKATIHWDTIVGRGRSDRDGFFFFFELYDRFLEELERGKQEAPEI